MKKEPRPISAAEVSQRINGSLIIDIEWCRIRFLSEIDHILKISIFMKNVRVRLKPWNDQFERAIGQFERHQQSCARLLDGSYREGAFCGLFYILYSTVTNPIWLHTLFSIFPRNVTKFQNVTKISICKISRFYAIYVTTLIIQLDFFNSLSLY